MFLPQIQERVDQSQRRLMSGLATPVGSLDQLREPFTLLLQLRRERQDGRLHALEVLVERGRRAPSALRNVDHGEVAVRRLLEQIGGAPQQALPGGPSPPARDPAVHRAQALLVGDRLEPLHRADSHAARTSSVRTTVARSDKVFSITASA